MNSVSSVVSGVHSGIWIKRVAAVLSGVVLVALAAQAAIPIPGTPVPITLQVPAVLIAGGLLGARLSAVSMSFYLAAGAVGLPVFAPWGLPGLARLLGPTGGYLLAFPLAAALVGFASARRSMLALSLSLVGGVLIIHASGVAQLTLLGGDAGVAIQLGSLPFLLGDAFKIVFAGLVIWRFAPATRAPA